MALKVYLIRHGETDFNKQNKEFGHHDTMPLNDLGILQSKKLATKLQNIKFDKLFSSELKRAMQTAETISKELNLPIIKDIRLKEYDPGEVDPSSEKWEEKYNQLLGSGMSKYDIRPFGGENIWDLIKRAQSFLKDIEKGKGTIAIIAHSGINSVLMNLSQKREKNEFIHMKQDNTCINILEFKNGNWDIKTINDSDHITDTIPKKEVYKNQEEIKKLIIDYIYEKLSKICNKIYLTGDILHDDFGFYDRPYKRYNGSTIEIYSILKEDFIIPKEWKISSIIKDIKKYEIGRIKIKEVNHKVNLTILLDKIPKGMKFNILK